MEYFAGLDVSMAETQVCVMSRDGAVTYEVKVPSTPSDIAGALGQAPTCERIVFETDRLELACADRCRTSRTETDLPPEEWTPGYADLASACYGVNGKPGAECSRHLGFVKDFSLNSSIRRPRRRLRRNSPQETFQC